jgi:hypothetical protein
MQGRGAGFLCSSTKVSTRYLLQGPNPNSQHSSETPGTPRPRLDSLPPSRVDAICEVEGDTLLSPTTTTSHHMLNYRGEVEFPKHEEWTCLQGFSMTEDAAIAIDRTTLQSVYTCTQLGMAPGQCTAHRAHPTMWTLGSYGLILHPALKAIPSAKGTAPELWNAPVWPHGRHTDRRWSHSHLCPIDTVYPASRYGSALAELNSALTPCSARCCVWKSYRQVDPLPFRPGQAHVLQV